MSEYDRLKAQRDGILAQRRENFASALLAYEAAVRSEQIHGTGQREVLAAARDAVFKQLEEYAR